MNQWPEFEWTVVDCESCDWDMETEYENELGLIAFIPDEFGEFAYLYRTAIKNLVEGPVFDELGSAQDWVEHRLLEGNW